MSEMTAIRWKRVHAQFLTAAAKYPQVHFVAVTAHADYEGWPCLPRGNGDKSFGLQDWDWRRICYRPKVMSLPMAKDVWLRIGGRLWQGALYDAAPEGESTKQVLARYKTLERAVKQFDQLARIAAGHFVMPDEPFSTEHPLQREPADRWLEVVCALPEVRSDDSGEHVVRRVPGDVFTASARAIEYLSELDPQMAAQVQLLHERRNGVADLRLATVLGQGQGEVSNWRPDFAAEHGLDVNDEQALDAKWREQFRHPMPKTVQDVKEWAIAAGLPLDEVLDGRRTMDEMVLAVRGYLRRMIVVKTGGQGPKKHPKRAQLLCNIELLTNAIIDHLNAARRSAIEAKARGETISLPPRPTKKFLGETVGLKPYVVTRCFKDPSARVLRIYWDTAGDPKKIMRWTTKRHRKTE